MIEKLIYNFCEKNNIIVGICDYKPMNYVKKFLNRKIPFVSSDVKVRTDPRITFKSCKSIVVVGLGYGKKEIFEKDDKLRGKISISAVGLDYHIKLRNILENMIFEIKKYINCDYRIFVDSGPLIERELAKKAGLGFTGKNCNIISEKFGSYFFIGYIMLDINLSSTKESKFEYTNCNACNICQNMCPTGAIQKEYFCDFDKCISFLTQTKEDIVDNLKQKMNTYIYGCDICQKYCPYNMGKEIENITDINISRPLLEEFLAHSNKDFKSIYKNTAMFWRGKNILKRNAQIALDNLKYFQ